MCEDLVDHHHLDDSALLALIFHGVLLQWRPHINISICPTGIYCFDSSPLHELFSINMLQHFQTTGFMMWNATRCVCGQPSHRLPSACGNHACGGSSYKALRDRKRLRRRLKAAHHPQQPQLYICLHVSSPGQQRDGLNDSD